MELRRISTPGEFENAFPIVKELRPHLTFQRYIELIREAAKRDQYKMMGAYISDECIGVVGYRILFDFVHGKHLYVDDLVVKSNHRSAGVGAKLLRYMENIARESDCEGLRLCTGLDNERGKVFYEREGWQARAVAYKKKL